MKTLEELRTTVTEFICQNPQFELCVPLLNKYVKAVLAYAKMRAMPVSMTEILKVIVEPANIQNRLKERMEAYNFEDKNLLGSFLAELNDATIGII